MAIYFMGGEMGAFTPSDSTVIESNSAEGFTTAFSRCAIDCPQNTNYAEGDPGTNLTDAWIHFRMSIDFGSSAYTSTRFVWLDGSGTERIRIRYTHDTNSLAVQYFNGSWVSAGSFTLFWGDTDHDFDLHVTCNSASGNIALYVAGTQRINATVDLSATTALRKFRFSGHLEIFVSTTHSYFSQVIVADESTIGFRLLTVPPTGVGASSDMTGTFAEVDEIAYSDADFINTSTANHVELFTHSTAIPSGYGVRAVGVTARAKKGGSGPTNLQLALRSGGTTYVSSSKALDLGYGSFINVWETDPATSAAFTSSAITAMQFGVKAIA